MTVTVAMAGDTMLGRGVARTLTRTPPQALVAPGCVPRWVRPTWSC